MTAKKTITRPDNPLIFRDTDEVNVDAMHQRIVAREQSEPEEGFEKPPWWLWAFSVLLLFGMGFYLGRFGGSWSTVAHEVESPTAAAAAPQLKAADGNQVFIGVCQTCHQSDGSGIPGQYPPLAGSEWLTNDAETPVRIVLSGLEGPITVRGREYNNKMPAFREKLTDDEIAAVLTHERRSWGNASGGVTAEVVETIRREVGERLPWNATALSSLRKK